MIDSILFGQIRTHHIVEHLHQFRVHETVVIRDIQDVQALVFEQAGVFGAQAVSVLVLHDEDDIGPADIRWADVIFVMEHKHANRLRAEYARLLEHKRLHILDIPDDYRFMDPELVEMLNDMVSAYLAEQD